MIKKLILKNWKKHENFTIDFSKGVNIIVGEMGTGKSSILQAINYCLFGSFNDLKSREIKTDDLISRNQSESELVLYIDNYIIHRFIKRGKTSESKITDETGQELAGPSTVEVNKFIEEKLKISEDVFLRAIYSSQNDIDKIIRVTPNQRKKILDELMNLNEFEIVRKNSVTLINKLNLEIQTNKKIYEETNIEELKYKLNETTNETGKINSKINEIKNKIPNLEKKYKDIERLLEEKSQIKYKYNSLKENLNQLKIKLSKKDKSLDNIPININYDIEIEKIDDYVTDIKNNIKDIRKINEKLNEEKLTHEKNISKFSLIISEHNKKILEFNNKYKEVNEKDIYKLNQEYDLLKNIISDMKLKFDNSKIKLRALRESLDKLNSMDSKCYVCDNLIDDLNKSNLISKRKSEIAVTLMKQNEITENLNNNQMKNEKLKILIDLDEDYQKENIIIREIKEKQISFENELLNLKKLNQKIDDELFGNKEKLKQLELKLDHKNHEIKELYKFKELLTRKNEFENYETEYNDIIKQINLINFDENKLNDLKKTFNIISNDLTESKYLLNELQNKLILNKEKIDLFHKSISNYTEINNRIISIQKKMDFLTKLKNKLFESQELLRDDLILAVNEELSNIWLDLYPYDNFTNLRITPINNDYFLQLKEFKGDWKNIVGYASGGEKMLSCIGTKIAFSKILSPSFGLIVLDEPTHNLDSNAVNNFINIMNNNIKSQINQIIIVTHDSRLSESGDKVIKLLN